MQKFPISFFAGKATNDKIESACTPAWEQLFGGESAESKTIGERSETSSGWGGRLREGGDTTSVLFTLFLNKSVSRLSACRLGQTQCTADYFNSARVSTEHTVNRKTLSKRADPALHSLLSQQLNLLLPFMSSQAFFSPIHLCLSEHLFSTFLTPLLSVHFLMHLSSEALHSSIGTFLCYSLTSTSCILLLFLYTCSTWVDLNLH